MSLNYIIIPNDVFKDQDKYQNRNLTAEELYLYSWLYRRRIPDCWTLEVTIDLINVFCYKFAKGNDSRNKKSIKDMLITLNQKKFIATFGDNSIDEKLKYSDPLHIEFPEVDTLIGYNGNITYQQFDQFEDPLEFFVYAYIDCFGDRGRSISYYKWSKLANKSESTIKALIDKMNTYKFKPRIWKFSGDYYESEYGEIRQQENTYYTRPDDDTIKKWNGFYAKEGSREWELAFGYKGKRRDDEWGDNNPF